MHMLCVHFFSSCRFFAARALPPAIYFYVCVVQRAAKMHAACVLR